MSDDAEEGRLVRRLKRRDEAAFETLVTRYQSKVFALVYRMLGDRQEAEDLAQEVFVTVFKSIDSFREESRLSTWIYRIATNHSRNRIKYLQRRYHKRTLEFSTQSEGEITTTWGQGPARPDRILEGQEMERFIQEALSLLDEDHRVVILLRDVEHLPYNEIAEILGVAEGTVKSRLFRARAALKTKLQGRTG